MASVSYQKLKQLCARLQQAKEESSEAWEATTTNLKSLKEAISKCRLQIQREGASDAPSSFWFASVCCLFVFLTMLLCSSFLRRGLLSQSGQMR